MDYSFTFPGGMIGVVDGINPRPKECEFMIGFPALTPETSLIIRVLSATRNEVIEVERHWQAVPYSIETSAQAVIPMPESTIPKGQLHDCGVSLNDLPAQQARVFVYDWLQPRCIPI